MAQSTTLTGRGDDPDRIDARPTKQFFITMLVRDIELIRAIIDLVDNCVDGARRMRPAGTFDGLFVHVDAMEKQVLPRQLRRHSCGCGARICVQVWTTARNARDIALSRPVRRGNETRAFQARSTFSHRISNSDVPIQCRSGCRQVGENRRLAVSDERRRRGNQRTNRPARHHDYGRPIECGCRRELRAGEFLVPTSATDRNRPSTADGQWPDHRPQRHEA